MFYLFQDGITDSVDSNIKNTFVINCSLTKISSDSQSTTGVEGKSALDRIGCKDNNAFLNHKELHSNDRRVIDVNRNAALNGSDKNVKSDKVMSNRCQDGSKPHGKLAHRRIPLCSQSDEHDNKVVKRKHVKVDSLNNNDDNIMNMGKICSKTIFS